VITTFFVKDCFFIRIVKKGRRYYFLSTLSLKSKPSYLIRAKKQ